MCEICRRGFIGGAAALGATGLFSSPLMAQTPRSDSGSTRAARARRVHHRQCLCDDDGARLRRLHRRLRACERRRDCRRRPRREWRRDDRRQRHDRDARPRRDPLAHVEHDFPQLCRRQAGGRLFPDRGALRPADDAGRHFPEHAVVGGGSDQFRHDLRALLVSQCAQHRARRSRYSRAGRRRHPRPPFLRLAAGPARYAIGRSGADRNPRQELEQLLQRGPDFARHGVGAGNSAPGRSSRRSISRNSTMPASSACRSPCMWRRPRIAR